MSTTSITTAWPEGHPFHDARAWEGPYTLDEQDVLAPGDLVLVERGATLVTVVAHTRDKDGVWRDGTGAVVLSAFGRLRPTAFWRVPSPGPEPLPLTPGALIRKVRDFEGDTADFLLLGPDGYWYGEWDVEAVDAEGTPAPLVSRIEPAGVLAFTDADGTAWSREDATSAWAEVQA